MSTPLIEQARQLSVSDQIDLVETLWDAIADGGAALPLPTDEQKAELDRRLADHEAKPDAAVPWTDVRSQALARIGR
jgi:putative addiction module component (TIGR02574 family)